MLRLMLSIVLGSVPAHAAGPGEGTITEHDVRIGSCTATSVTVKYELDSLMGEPTVKASFKWEGEPCDLPASTNIWLEVRDSAGSKGYVKVSPATPDAGEGYGYNTTGSPGWNRLLCGYANNRATECLPSDRAKDLWTSGSVRGFHVGW